MPLYLGVGDYLVIAAMLAVSAAIGIFFRFTGGRQKTTQEFLMAGKDMGILPVAFSLMATYMSAISVLGIPSDVYMYGTQFSFWIVGTILGGVISAFLFVPIFFQIDACTAYEYLQKRFGKVTRSIISMLFILQMILYMSIVLYAPSLALNAVTGLSTWTSVISLAVVCTLYCSLGGLKAVLWTDVFQSILMYVTIISIVVMATVRLGGLSNVGEIANAGGRLILTETSIDLTVRYTVWNGLLGGMLFSLSTFGTNQAQIQRMLSVGNLRKAQTALFISIPLIMFFILFCFWDGVVIYSLFHDCDPMLNPINATVTSPDQLLPLAIMTLFGGIPGIAGLGICGVFAASLSTISSAVNSLTAVTMEDFIRPYCFCKKLSESWAAFLAKTVAMMYGLFCLCLTIIVANFRGVLEASNIVFGMVAGPVLGVFSLGMFTTTANETGTLIGLLIGFTFNAWLSFGSYAAKVKVPTLKRTIEGCPGIESLKYNVTGGTSFYENATSVVNLISENVDTTDEFYLYRISFMWYGVFGAIAVISLGYICSHIVACFCGKKEVNEVLISPVFRSWYFSSPTKTKFLNGGQVYELKHAENNQPDLLAIPKPNS